MKTKVKREQDRVLNKETGQYEWVWVERTRYIPEAEIPRAHHWLLLHGRYVCTSRSPHCPDCPFAEWCPGREKGF